MEVRAGSQTLRNRLYAWLDRGDWNFQSAAAPRIAGLRYDLAEAQPAPPVYFGHANDGPDLEHVAEHMDLGWTVIRGTAARE